MRDKICFVLPYYSENPQNAIEEYYSQLVNGLTLYYEVTVLTTCANAPNGWINSYKQGISYVNKTKVVRFLVDYNTDGAYIEHIKQLYNTKKLKTAYKQLQLPKAIGPYCEAILHYIQVNQSTYSAFIFAEYLSYTTFFGLPMVFSKSILLPLALNGDTYAQMPIVKALFKLPAALFYLNEPECAWACQNFNLPKEINRIGGVGISLLPNNQEDNMPKEPYVLYIGELNQSTIQPVVDTWIRYKEKNPSNLKLAFINAFNLELPKHEDVFVLQYKNIQNAFKGACCTWFGQETGQYTLQILQSIACNTPIVCNAKNPFSLYYINQTQAGLSYDDETSFSLAIQQVFKDTSAYVKMQENGKNYLQAKCLWSSVIDELSTLIDSIKQKPNALKIQQEEQPYLVAEKLYEQKLSAKQKGEK